MLITLGRNIEDGLHAVCIEKEDDGKVYLNFYAQKHGVSNFKDKEASIVLSEQRLLAISEYYHRVK